MKRMITFALAALLTFSLCACGVLTDQKDNVTFYYQRLNFAYGDEDGVIAPEERELAGYGDNLPYLMTLYFHGPQSDDLVSPFPSGIAVMDIQTEEEVLTVTLNSVLTQLKDLELTIACVCLAKTCFSLTDAQEVQIESMSTISGDNVSVVITRDNYLLEDAIPTETAPTEKN